MLAGYNVEEMRSELLDIDEEIGLEIAVGNIEQESERFDLILVGGSVFFLRGVTSRKVSSDIDVLQLNDAISSVIARHPMLNQRALVYEDQLPYNYEDRLCELPLDTRYVRYLAPCNEDLAVMKLYAARDSDIDDLCSPKFAKSIDWNLLDMLVHEEAPMSRGCETKVDRRYQEMLVAYEDYVSYCEKEGYKGA